MFLAPFISVTGLIVLLAALALSTLLYLKNIKGKILPVANLALLLTFLFSLFYAIHILSQGLGDPAEFAKMLGETLLMNVYAGIVNVAARVWVRVREFMGNKHLQIKIQARIVESKTE